MKPQKKFAYFPVLFEEQAVLERIRRPDLTSRLDEVLRILDLVAGSQLSADDLEQAIQLLVESRQGEDLDARLDNLEGRLRERLERALVEIEGRLSKRLAGEAPATATTTAKPNPPSPRPTAVPAATLPSAPPVPKNANLAIRIGTEVVWGPTAAQFYVQLWRWLFENGRVKPTDLPIKSGKIRYVVAATPIHPSGKAFTRSGEPVPGAFVEVNLSRADILGRTKKYLAHYGVSYDMIVGSED